jgi:hypothetical protein
VYKTQGELFSSPGVTAGKNENVSPLVSQDNVLPTVSLTTHEFLSNPRSHSFVIFCAPIYSFIVLIHDEAVKICSLSVLYFNFSFMHKKFKSLNRHSVL